MFQPFWRVAIAALMVAPFPRMSASAAPSVALSPILNHPSSQVTVSGSGFGAGKGIDVYWDTSDEMLVVSDSTGTFRKKAIPVPSSALPGTHWVTALERDNGNGAQASFTVRTDWIEHGFGSRGRRYNPYENVISPGNAAKLDVAWTYTTGDIIESSPAVVAGTVYIGSNDGYLYALNATTGAKKWSTKVGRIDYSSPAVVGGVVYIGSLAGKIYALNATNGSVKWVYPSSGNLGFNVQSSPTVVAKVVYIGADDGNLYALNASTGAKLWSFLTTADDQVWSAPAVWQGVAYIGSGDRSIYAISTTTHAKLWSAPTSDVVLSSPAVANQHVFAGSYDETLSIIDDNSGLDRFYYTTGSILSSAAIADGTVYFGSQDGKLRALTDSLASSTYLWQYDATVAINSSPAAANGVIYFGQDKNATGEGYITALDSGTGSVLWQGHAADSVTSSPAVANGMVYVGSYDHKVYAFALDAGANSAYHRKQRPPSYASLHPNPRLKPIK